MISASLAYQAPCPPPLMSRWSTSGWSSPWPSLSLKWLCTPTKRPSSWSWTSSGSHMTSPLQCLPKSNQWNDSSLSTRPKKMFKGLLAIKSICFDFYGKVEKENDILWASFGQGAPFCSNRSFLSFSLGPILHNLKISKPLRIFFIFLGFTVGFCSIGIVAHFSSPPEPSNCFWSTEKFLKEHEKSRQPREVSYLDNLQNDTFLNWLEGHFQKQEGWEPDFKMIWVK